MHGHWSNPGIGKETAREPAKMGATVVIVCRNRQKGSLVSGLLEVILHVKNMNSQIEFYREKLGLKVTWPQGPSDYSKECWVTFETGPCTLALHDGGRTHHGESPSHRIVPRVHDIDCERRIEEV